MSNHWVVEEAIGGRRCQPIRKKANEKRGVRLDLRTPGSISILSFPHSKIERGKANKENLY